MSTVREEKKRDEWRRERGEGHDERVCKFFRRVVCKSRPDHFSPFPRSARSSLSLSSPLLPYPSHLSLPYPVSPSPTVTSTMLAALLLLSALLCFVTLACKAAGKPKVPLSCHSLLEESYWFPKCVRSSLAIQNVRESSLQEPPSDAVVGGAGASGSAEATQVCPR